MDQDDYLNEVFMSEYDRLRSSSVFVRWAAHALETGLDSDSVRMLAGFPQDENYFEVKAMFNRALGELSLSVPDERSVRKEYLKRVARRIVGGDLLPSNGVREIEERVLAPLH